MNLQPYFFFNKTEEILCFRVFNYGLNFIDRSKQPAPFSVRSGSRKQWRVFKTWYVMILTPPSDKGIGRP